MNKQNQKQSNTSTEKVLLIFIIRAYERSGNGWNFRSPLTPPSVTPAHRSTPSHATSRSRSIVFFHAQLPLRSRSAPAHSIFGPAPLQVHSK